MESSYINHGRSVCGKGGSNRAPRASVISVTRTEELKGEDEDMMVVTSSGVRLERQADDNVK